MTQAHTPGPDGTQKRHPFSFTLGEGPYRFVGTYDMGRAVAAVNNGSKDTAAAFQDAPRLEAGLGTCAHCGHAILNICIVRRGDGKLYGVGSDCILKVAASGDVSEVSKLERMIRQAKSEKAAARKQAKIDALMPDFKDALEVLKDQPHPNEHFASKGKTAADYFNFIPWNEKNMKA